MEIKNSIPLIGTCSFCGKKVAIYNKEYHHMGKKNNIKCFRIRYGLNECVGSDRVVDGDAGGNKNLDAEK